MDFSLTDENNAVFDMAYEFGQEFIAPYALAWEKEGNIPKDLWAKAGELGLGGIYVSEEFGGSGLDRFSATLIFEALAMACPSVGSFLTIHNMCGGMIEKFGSLELKEKWLPKLCKMETIFSYCLSEPGSGSDAAALKTKAKKTKPRTPRQHTSKNKGKHNQKPKQAQGKTRNHKGNTSKNKGRRKQ